MEQALLSRISKAFNTCTCVSLPKGSKRCFPNGVFQILHLGSRQRSTPSEAPKIPENSSVFRRKTAKPKKRMNSTKEFSEQFKGTTQQNKGFEAKIAPESSPENFGKIFVAKVLWGAFSVPDPWSGISKPPCLGGLPVMVCNSGPATRSTSQ